MSDIISVKGPDLEVALENNSAGIASETTLITLNDKIPANLTVSSTRLLVDGSGVTQPVSLASLPVLPAGSNTIGSINNILGTVSLPTGASTEATLSALSLKVPNNLTVFSTRLLVDGSGVTQPVSLASLPVLPAGSNTIGSINNVLGTVSLPTGASTEATLSALNLKVPNNLTVSSTRLLVDGSGAIQPITLPENLVTLFSRLRVANEETQISFRQDTPLRPLLITEGQVSGSGTSSSYALAQASTVLSVGTTVGLRRMRSRTAGLYTAGNGLLCFYTFNLEGNGEANVTKRAGYFDDGDGIFLEQKDGALSFVLRSSVTGSIVETRVGQANWIDKFDGTGEGYNFDTTKCHIGWISLEWLGVGDVYCGFVYDAKPVVAYVFRHPNLAALPYMRTASLFLNYEVERTVGGGTPQSLRAVCATLKTEGSLNKTGVAQIISTNVSRATALANTLYPLVTFRLRPGYLTARVLISSFEAIINDNAATTCQFLLVKNPVIAGYSFSGTALPNSSIEYQSSATTPVIGTTLVISSYEQLLASKTVNIVQNTFVTASSEDSSVNYMGSSFDNTPDLYCLAMTSTTASNTVPTSTIHLWEQL